jgi:hypothetical protein
MGNFIDFDVLFPNFNFATSYFCRSRRHIGKMAPKSSFLTHAHPLSSPFFWTTQHEYNNTQHPWEAHPAWDSNPAALAVVSKECRSSSHHPTVSPCYTYTHIHGPAEVPSFEKIVPLRWDSNPLAPGPRPRSIVSDSHAATELLTFFLMDTCSFLDLVW